MLLFAETHIHGNGNAYVFMHDSTATLLDIYNKDIYPQGMGAAT